MSRHFPDSSQKLKALDHLEHFDTVVVGPGLGLGDESRELVKEILMNFSGPVVLDADAIYALDYEEGRRLLSGRKQPVVMTPHLGEFAGLCSQGGG